MTTRPKRFMSYYRRWYRRQTADLDSKQIRIYDKWNRVLFFLFVLVSVMMVFGIGHPPVGLSTPEPHGHLLWFLILLSLPMLPVYGLINFLAGHHLSNILQILFCNFQFLVLGANVLVELIILTFLGRWTLHFRSGAEVLELLRNCMWIIFYYGILCFCSFIIMLIWVHGRFAFYF